MNFTKPEFKKTERSFNQDSFLNHIRKNKIPVSLFLLNGVKIQGMLSYFDTGSLIIKREGNYQLIYKHAISTIVPHYLINQENHSSDLQPI